MFKQLQNLQKIKVIKEKVYEFKSKKNLKISKLKEGKQ
jgi:hypothetical protein